MTDRQHYTTAQVAKRLAKSERSIRDYITRGCMTPRGLVRLHGMKAGKSWLVPDDDLDAFEHRIRRNSRPPDLSTD